MAVSISEKGRRIVQLIKAVQAAGEIVPGAKVLMLDGGRGLPRTSGR